MASCPRTREYSPPGYKTESAQNVEEAILPVSLVSRFHGGQCPGHPLPGVLDTVLLCLVTMPDSVLRRLLYLKN